MAANVLWQLDTDVADRHGRTLEEVAAAEKDSREREGRALDIMPLDPVRDAVDAEARLDRAGDDADAGIDRNPAAAVRVIPRDHERRVEDQRRIDRQQSGVVGIQPQPYRRVL